MGRSGVQLQERGPGDLYGSGCRAAHGLVSNWRPSAARKSADGDAGEADPQVLRPADPHQVRSGPVADAATERGRLASVNEPRARAARYDRRLRRVVAELANGCTFEFRPDPAEAPEDATDDRLAGVELPGAGCRLHREARDVDLSVPGLVGGLFGTRA